MKTTSSTMRMAILTFGLALTLPVSALARQGSWGPILKTFGPVAAVGRQHAQGMVGCEWKGRNDAPGKKIPYSRHRDIFRREGKINGRPSTPVSIRPTI